jgi:hypothetical protein
VIVALPNLQKLHPVRSWFTFYNAYFGFEGPAGNT